MKTRTTLLATLAALTLHTEAGALKFPVRMTPAKAPAIPSAATRLPAVRPPVSNNTRLLPGLITGTMRETFRHPAAQLPPARPSFSPLRDLNSRQGMTTRPGSAPRPAAASPGCRPATKTPAPAVRVKVTPPVTGNASSLRSAGKAPAVSSSRNLPDQRKLDALNEARGLKDAKDAGNLRFSGLRGPDELKDVFTGQRGGASSAGLADPFAAADSSTGMRSPKAPGSVSSRFEGGGLKDIRGDMRNSRRAGDEDTSGDWNMGPNEYMHRDGSRHHTAGTETQGSIQHYNPEGKYSGRTDWSSNRSGDHATYQHYDNEGQHTSTVVVDVMRDGTERKTVYQDGQEPVVTHSDDVSHGSSVDRNPEGGSLGGANGPGMEESSGLLPLDLVRQFGPDGRSTGTGGVSPARIREGQNRVNPGQPGSATTGNSRPGVSDLVPDTTVVNPAPSGGEPLSKD